IKLSRHINELVRFKLHEIAGMKEGTIRAIDQHGFWIEGGSLAEYLRSTSAGADANSDVQFIEFKRVHWSQKVRKSLRWRNNRHYTQNPRKRRMKSAHLRYRLIASTTICFPRSAPARWKSRGTADEEPDADRYCAFGARANLPRDCFCRNGKEIG